MLGSSLIICHVLKSDATGIERKQKQEYACVAAKPFILLRKLLKSVLFICKTLFITELI